MAWQEVHKGRGKGGSGVEASLAAMQNSIAQLAASISNTCTPQGKGAPPQGKGQGKGGGKGNVKGGAQGGKPQTLLREGHTHHEGNQVCGLPVLQLDHTQRVQILWSETAPGATHPETRPTVPGTGAQQPGCAFLLLCGIIWFVIRQCCQGVHQADGKEKDKAMMTQKAERLAHILATLPESDPLREDLQSQLDQLRNDLRDPHQPGAGLDSAIANQRKAEAKVQKRKETLNQAEGALQSAQEEKTASDSELKAAQAAATTAPPPPEPPPTLQEAPRANDPGSALYGATASSPREIAALADPTLPC